MSDSQARQLSLPWASSAEGFPVRTSLARETERALPANDPGSGTSSRASSTNCVPLPSSSRTFEAAHGAGCAQSEMDCTNLDIERAPWGLPPATLEHLTAGPESSSLLPTLTAKGNLLSPSMQKWPAHRRLLPTLTATSYGSNRGGAAGRSGPERPSLDTLAGGTLDPQWCEWFMGFPIGWTDVEP